MFKKLTVLVVIGLCFAAQVSALDIPAYDGYVNDFAGVISQDTEDLIEGNITRWESETTNELAVVTIPSLEGESLETYANELFQAWGIGKADKDNGVLLLFAIEERRVRLEVGYGMEPFINDAKAGRILDENVVSYRDAGNYDMAALNGAGAIMAVETSFAPITAPEEPEVLPQPTEDITSSVEKTFIGIVIFAIALYIINRLAIRSLEKDPETPETKKGKKESNTTILGIPFFWRDYHSHSSDDDDNDDDDDDDGISSFGGFGGFGGGGGSSGGSGGGGGFSGGSSGGGGASR